MLVLKGDFTTGHMFSHFVRWTKKQLEAHVSSFPRFLGCGARVSGFSRHIGSALSLIFNSSLFFFSKYLVNSNHLRKHFQAPLELSEEWPAFGCQPLASGNISIPRYNAMAALAFVPGRSAVKNLRLGPKEEKNTWFLQPSPLLFSFLVFLVGFPFTKRRRKHTFSPRTRTCENV